MMRASKLTLVAIILIGTTSCTIPDKKLSVQHTPLASDQQIECMLNDKNKRNGYNAPSLPDLSRLENDYEVVDELIDHIDKLRRELRELSKTDC